MKSIVTLAAVAVVAFAGLLCMTGCQTDKPDDGPVIVNPIHCSAPGCSVCTPCAVCRAKMGIK